MTEELIQHGTSQEAFAAFMESLQDVASGDRWLAACWHVKDGKIELVRATSYEFHVEGRTPAEQSVADG
jgi:hypothetical protein